MNNLFRILIICSLSLVVISCNLKPKNTKNNVTAERIENVKVKTLKKTSIARQIELSTTLQGYESMNIAPSLSGRIEHIYVEVGSKVKPGDMLVRMDQNQLNTTKLTFANLGIEYERMKKLRETETVSEQSYDQIKLSYDQTKESLDFLEKNTFVKANMKGVISAKNYEDGELFAGTPILTLTQIHQLKALINIPESYYPYVKEGMKLELFSEIYPDQTFPAIIEIVYPTIDPSTHSFQAKLKITNQNEILRPGMYVRTTLSLGKIDAIVVPYQSVLKLTGSNERYLFVNNNGVAKRVRVSLGQRFDEMVEVKSDNLTEGDQLVVLGQARLVDGVKLNVIK